MERFPRLLLASALIVLVALCGAGVAWSGQCGPAPSPPYTVAQVQAAITHHPLLWLDRTVRVAGYVSATCGLPGGCTLRPPGEPPFGLAMRPSTATDDALPHGFPLKPVEPSLRARLFGAPEQTLLVSRWGIYTMTITRLSHCDLENRPTPCVVGLIAGAHTTPQ